MHAYAVVDTRLATKNLLAVQTHVTNVLLILNDVEVGLSPYQEGDVVLSRSHRRFDGHGMYYIAHFVFVLWTFLSLESEPFGHCARFEWRPCFFGATNVLHNCSRLFYAMFWLMIFMCPLVRWQCLHVFV